MALRSFGNLLTNPSCGDSAPPVSLGRFSKGRFLCCCGSVMPHVTSPSKVMTPPGLQRNTSGCRYPRPCTRRNFLVAYPGVKPYCVDIMWNNRHNALTICVSHSNVLVRRGSIPPSLQSKAALMYCDAKRGVGIRRASHSTPSQRSRANMRISVVVLKRNNFGRLFVEPWKPGRGRHVPLNFAAQYP